MQPTRCVVVMGVSGSGKTTVGAQLAERLGWPFADADDFHSAGNVAKMRAGVALDDDDRRPWLEALTEWISARHREGCSSVLSCSALRRSHRDQLRRAEAPVLCVQLDLGRAEAERRMRARTDHFMPPALLASQLEALEPLAPDETGLIVDATLAPGTIVHRVRGIVAGGDAGVTG